MRAPANASRAAVALRRVAVVAVVVAAAAAAVAAVAAGVRAEVRDEPMRLRAHGSLFTFEVVC